jgi:acetyl-CoA synthetase
MPPYARIRRLEFAELPKTISGKIRRVELRAAEREKHAEPTARPEGEFTG